MNGGARGGNFGYAVASLGDVNLDGVADFAVGIPNDPTAAPNAGRVRVYSGQNGSLLFSVNGLNAGDQFGFSICGIPDTNGDGRAEILVGAPFADPSGANSGQVRLLSGQNGTTLLTLNGAAAGNQFGRSVAFGGTVSGVRRLVIGAPYSDTGTTNAGSVYLYTAAGTLLQQAHGTQANEHLGWSVAGGFDVGTDGTPDVAAGAPDFDDNGADAGRVRVYSGATFSVLYTLASAGPGHRFGYSVAMLQDVNGDARGDVLVGAPYFNGDSGAAYVHSGNLGSILYTKLGSSNSHFGWSVATCGDTNADGRTDYLVGAPDETFVPGVVGGVRLFSGINGSMLKLWRGADVDGKFGYSVSGGNDMTGDGRGDLVIGAPDMDTQCVDQGAAYAYDSNGFSPLHSIDGPANGDQFGNAVCALGDVNNDGKADFLVGSPAADHTFFTFPPLTSTNQDAGSVKCVSGADGTTVLWTIYGSGAGDELGFSLVRLGDVNGDGRPDFAAGAPQRKAATNPFGYVRICSGVNGATIATTSGSGLDAEFGYALGIRANAGGTGIPRLLVGAPGYDTDRGRAVLLQSPFWTSVVSYTGTAAGERFGESVAGTGDANADGQPDVAIGAPSNDAVASNAGRVYVMSGVASSTIGILSGTQSSERFGASICSLRSDYYDVLAIGSPGYDYAPSSLTNCGRVSLYFTVNLLPYTTVIGTANFEGLGATVVNIGDYNLDGFDDIGAYGSENALFVGGPGKVRVVSGYYGVTMYEFSQGASFDGYGVGIAGGQDINADGTLDIVIGAPYSDENGTSSGSVRVWSLKPNGVDYYGTGTAGCNGPQKLRFSTAPKLGTYWFLHGVDNAPVSSLGLLLATNSPDFAGSDPFGLGVKLHVDFFAATETYGLDINSLPSGHGLAVTPIGSNPAIIGMTFYVQTLWVWSSCPLPPLNLSSSAAGSLTIQP